MLAIQIWLSEKVKVTNLIRKEKSYADIAKLHSKNLWNCEEICVLASHLKTQVTNTMSDMCLTKKDIIIEFNTIWSFRHPLGSWKIFFVDEEGGTTVIWRPRQRQTPFL